MTAQLAFTCSNLPITLILDNARYQHGHLVIDLAAQLGIELLFLPPYSPNLNLIERLWKFIKKEGLYSHYSESFADFKLAITNCLADAQDKHQHALTSLLSLNFQTFENATL